MTRARRPIRLAVLSDLHIWSDASADSWSSARDAFRAAAELDPDHVVIAGDTFDCATAFRQDAPRVKRDLRSLELWDPERLTIVVGNHDVFHTPHRGSTVAIGLEHARALGGGAQRSYEAFCRWAGHLAPRADRCFRNDLFPFVKRVGHVLLMAADTTATTTPRSANGYWGDETDQALREVDGGSLRKILAIHHPPYESPENAESMASFLKQVREGWFHYGMPARDFARLESFADDRGLDAIVCGHIHSNGGDPFEWEIGQGTPVYMVGRTGGLHDEERCIGLLEVPVKGAVRWKVVRF